MPLFSIMPYDEAGYPMRDVKEGNVSVEHRMSYTKGCEPWIFSKGDCTWERTGTKQAYF
jgi:hypothetical protein